MLRRLEEAHVTQPKTPASAPTPSPQELNRITTQLRDLNAAYKAAVASNGKTQAGSAPRSKSGK
jgi:hypothetical protein